MKGGDLSNELPRRAIATADCFLQRRASLERKLGILLPGTEVSIDRQVLSRLWRFAEKHGYVMEMAVFGDDLPDQIMTWLEETGTNPFNHAVHYNLPADLVALLPYRPEIACVIDIPSRALRYGSWFLDLERV